jgi:hypothetical protein
VDGSSLLRVLTLDPSLSASASAAVRAWRPKLCKLSQQDFYGQRAPESVTKSPIPPRALFVRSPMIRLYRNLLTDIHNLDTLPLSPVEQRAISLLRDDTNNVLGVSLVALGPLSVDEILVEDVPRASRLGQPLSFRLCLVGLTAPSSEAMLSVAHDEALSFLRAHAQLRVSLSGHGGVALRQRLSPSISPVASSPHRLCVSIDVFSVSTAPAVLTLEGLYLAGCAVPTAAFPAEVNLCDGLRAPLTLPGAAKYYLQTPAVSITGTLYVPLCNSSVLVFAADGTPLPPILALRSVIALAIDDTSDTLILTSASEASSRIVAVNATSGEVLWESRVGVINHCLGAAVITSRGVVVLSSREELGVFRVSDGAKLSRVACNEPSFVVWDACTQRVYATVLEGRASVIASFKWSGTDGDQLVQDKAASRFPALADEFGPPSFPLAIVPPVAGASSQLVICSSRSRVLRVVSLVDMALVAEFLLPEGHGNVKGLAADPCGTALVVCSSEAGAAFVLPWPLKGLEAATPATP